MKLNELQKQSITKEKRKLHTKQIGRGILFEGGNLSGQAFNLEQEEHFKL